MGMSMYAQAIKPPDAKWERMAAAFRACRDAGVEPPREIWEYFDGCEPDEVGVVIELGHGDGGTFDVEDKCCRRVPAEMGLGCEVEITKLPKDVQFVRFFCSW